MMDGQIGENIFEDALLHRNQPLKGQIKYLHGNTLYDDVLTRFGAALNHIPTDSDQFIADWSHHTRVAMDRLRKAGIDYNYFLTGAAQHTLTTNKFYHTCKSDGISYAEWLKRNVIDDEPLSLGEKWLSA